MLLSQYLEDKGLLKKHRAKIFDATDNGDSITVLYRVEGQRYKNDKDFSARALPKAIYDKQEVDDNGYLTTGRTIRKSNFWIWEPSSEDVEA